MRPTSTAASRTPTYRTDQLRASSGSACPSATFWSREETGPWTLAGNGQDGARGGDCQRHGSWLYRALGKLTNHEAAQGACAPRAATTRARAYSSCR